MAKTKLSEYSSTPSSNTDIDSINIAEGCAPSGINNAIRELMAHLKDFQTGASSDNLTVGGNLAVTGTTTTTGNVTAANLTATNLTASSSATIASADINAGTIDGAVIGGSSAQAITGTTITATTGFSGPLTGAVTGNTTGTHTGAVTGNVTGNLTGNVTSTGSSTFNNVTINGTLDMDASSSATITNLPSPTNSGDAANKAYVDAQVAALVDSAPGALDTLNELAAALGDDASFSTTVTTSIAAKLPLAGGTMTGNIAMGTNKVTGLGTPSASADAATKGYVDTQDALKLSLTGGTMSGAIAMGTSKITGLGDPSSNQDAATKAYVDGILGSATSAATSAAAAATSATNAATSASNASTSASNASTSATAAASSATAAAASYDSFDDRYLGSKSSAPSVDNDGNALLTGALYWNSTGSQLYVWSGSAWVQSSFTAGSFLTSSDIGSTVQAYDADLTTLGAGGSAARSFLGLAIGTNVQAWDADLDTWAGKTAPSGTVVGTTDTQTLTNKTITGTKETVYTITDGAGFEIDPANGGIQVVTLGASRSPAATNFTAGQSMILGIDDGSAYTLTWPTITWATTTATAPTLATSGYTWVVLWKVGSTLYGKY